MEPSKKKQKTEVAATDAAATATDDTKTSSATSSSSSSTTSEMRVQTELMPLLPLEPPMAESTTPASGPKGMLAVEKQRMGLQRVRRNYTPQDALLWGKGPSEMYVFIFIISYSICMYVLVYLTHLVFTSLFFFLFCSLLIPFLRSLFSIVLFVGSSSFNQNNFSKNSTHLISKNENEISCERTHRFRAQKKQRDANFASEYMNWWFAEHVGMPKRPPTSARSAYALYAPAAKRELTKEQGHFNTKKDSKKIAAKWKTLGAEEMAIWNGKLELSSKQYEMNCEWYDEQMTLWREARNKRNLESGEEQDPMKRQEAGLNPLCNCERCYGE